MPYTISAAFNTLLRGLPPSPTEHQDATSHQASIRSCLQNAFGLEAFFRIGSYERATSVAGFSDVDFLAVLPLETAYGIQPRTFITKVKNALQRRFALTPVGIKGQAVVLHFSAGQRAVDIVPAVYSTTRNGHHVYRIADGDYWLYTSPSGHNAYFRSIDTRCQSTMRQLVRVLKAWKYYQNAPIMSFHVDLLTASCCQSGRIDLANGVETMLNILLSRNLASLRDPSGFAGLIPATSTESARLNSLGKLRDSVFHANKASIAEQDGDEEEAFRQWRMVFAGWFPRYG